ncbi:multidrug effflux MFS transporter [Kluyvera sp. SCKS090646]|uniref:Bcr/CflA family efflux transporter n=1 Tax=Kluyvera sichuanensis TaxID=2725494 RepID=A0ABR6RMS0_9ENTR|nr:multidrug effflux MFS transporter [Kluyvera sichuanensis]MBC1184305.1 multidrug effflux MFS transporter [Kluyvera sichuanensis]
MSRTDHSTPNKRAATSGIFFILILGALMAFTSLSTDIYLPAMPMMAAELQGNVELTITGFLIGFSFAQLIWGPISDRVGRRIPLFIGMVLFVIGSAGCALSSDMPQIVFWRVFQAFGACTGPMLARAMIRDLYARTRAAQMLSTLVIISAIAPVVGPLLGGQIVTIASWRAVFWLLVVMGAAMFIALWWLPETLPGEKRLTTPISSAFGNYASLVKNREFMRYTLCVSFFYVAAYAFIAGSPFVYISYYHVDPQHYGWLFAVNIIGVMALSSVNRRLVQRHPLHTLLRVAAFVAALATVLLALSVKTHIGGMVAMVLTIFIFFSMNGIVAAASTAAALDTVPSNLAGSASALIGSLQYGSGIVSSLLLSVFSDGTPWAMAWIMMAFTLLCFVMVMKGKGGEHRTLAQE